MPNALHEQLRQAPATTPDTPDTPETLLLDADAELRASHQRAPTPETVLTGADAELRAVLRETPQRARAAVQAVVGRIVDAPDDERFQRINAESRKPSARRDWRRAARCSRRSGLWRTARTWSGAEISTC